MNKLLKLAVWIFPLVALALSAYLARSYFKERGPRITIEFEDADQVEANKTKIVYRGIAVGKVEKTELSDDARKAIAVVRMAAHTEDLLRKQTRFLVVQPQVSMEGISGLETLVKGAVIRLDPGQGEPTRHFKGTQTSEIGTTDKDAVIYQLMTPHADALGPDDPLFFRGAKIGKVVDARLDKSARGVVLDVAVFKPYVRVIRANSVFWRKQAVKADVGLFGSNIEIGSFETMMKGGINVATPSPAAKIAPAGANFVLRETAPEGWRQWSPALTFSASAH